MQHLLGSSSAEQLSATAAVTAQCREYRVGRARTREHTYAHTHLRVPGRASERARAEVTVGEGVYELERGSRDAASGTESKRAGGRERERDSAKRTVARPAATDCRAPTRAQAGEREIVRSVL